MPAALIDLIVRMGGELELDIAKNIVGGAVDVVWFDPRLPIAGLGEGPIDLRVAPALPIVAFAVRAAAMLESDAAAAALIAGLAATLAPLRVIIAAAENRQAALAPALKSVDALEAEEHAAVVRKGLVQRLENEPPAQGRTIVLLQQELVDWAKRLRAAKPRSYSAESLFHRMGALD